MTDFDPKKPLRTIEGHIKFRVIWQDKTGLLLEKKEGGSRMWVGELWAQQHLENIPELSQDDATGLDSECVILDVPTAEALLRVLLDICPNAQNAVDDWLARERLMIVERGGREP